MSLDPFDREGLRLWDGDEPELPLHGVMQGSAPITYWTPGLFAERRERLREIFPGAFPDDDGKGVRR